ncbi:hypothetical protein HMPREF9135_1194 [Segatella baroniae F0067]|uniref:Uncharacterized protein n=1 Tax=Segatella baroniae F0067 TaxID=1115809 RepID=U2P5S0_9BACT|nr:hypothetical protein HMPREF9135_1194 [Segatella baroniae F0067]
MTLKFVSKNDSVIISQPQIYEKRLKWLLLKCEMCCVQCEMMGG